MNLSYKFGGSSSGPWINHISDAKEREQSKASKLQAMNIDIGFYSSEIIVDKDCPIDDDNNYKIGAVENFQEYHEMKESIANNTMLMNDIDEYDKKGHKTIVLNSQANFFEVQNKLKESVLNESNRSVIIGPENKPFNSENVFEGQSQSGPSYNNNFQQIGEGSPDQYQNKRNEGYFVDNNIEAKKKRMSLDTNCNRYKHSNNNEDQHSSNGTDVLWKEEPDLHSNNPHLNKSIGDSNLRKLSLKFGNLEDGNESNLRFGRRQTGEKNFQKDLNRIDLTDKDGISNFPYQGHDMTPMQHGSMQFVLNPSYDVNIGKYETIDYYDNNNDNIDISDFTSQKNKGRPFRGGKKSNLTVNTLNKFGMYHRDDKQLNLRHIDSHNEIPNEYMRDTPKTHAEVNFNRTVTGGFMPSAKNNQRENYNSKLENILLTPNLKGGFSKDKDESYHIYGDININGATFEKTYESWLFRIQIIVKELRAFPHLLTLFQASLKSVAAIIGFENTKNNVYAIPTILMQQDDSDKKITSSQIIKPLNSTQYQLMEKKKSMVNIRKKELITQGQSGGPKEYFDLSLKNLKNLLVEIEIEPGRLERIMNAILSELEYKIFAIRGWKGCQDLVSEGCKALNEFLLDKDVKAYFQKKQCKLWEYTISRYRKSISDILEIHCEGAYRATESQLELIGVLFEMYGEWKDLKIQTDIQEALVASNMKRFIKGLEESIKASYEPLYKQEKFNYFKKSQIYNSEFENFVMSNNLLDKLDIQFYELGEFLSKTDKGEFVWFEIDKPDCVAKNHYMHPFSQFLSMLNGDNEGAVVMVNKILFKELICLLTVKKGSVSFKGAIALVVNLSAYVYELKGRLLSRYEDLILKLEELRILRLFLVKLLVEEQSKISAIKIHSVNIGNNQNSNLKLRLQTGHMENELSQDAMNMVETMLESKAAGFALPNRWSLTVNADKIPFFYLTI